MRHLKFIVTPVSAVLITVLLVVALLNLNVSAFSDAFDLNGAQIVGGSPSDVASWPATAEITGVSLSPINIAFTKRGGPDAWPDQTDLPGFAPDPLQYTVWMFLKINGVWTGSGFIQMWQGLSDTGTPLENTPCDWYYYAEPMAGHQLTPGEQIGFMVTAGNARGRVNPPTTHVVERSNVVIETVPANLPAPHCQPGGPGTNPGGTGDTNLLADIQAARAKYGAKVSHEQAAKILDTVAWNHRAEGWGLLSKTGGNTCPVGSATVACDILFNKNSGNIYDVFSSGPGICSGVSAAGNSGASWNLAGPADTARWIAPINPAPLPETMGGDQILPDSTSCDDNTVPGDSNVTVPKPSADGVDALAGEDPGIAFDPLKRLWLVVAENGGKIQGQLMTDSNKKSGSLINIGGSGAHTPKVAYGSNIGKFLVVWTSGTGTSGTLHGQLLNEDGSASGAAFQISSGGATLYSDSNLQYDSRGQRFVLAYEKSGNRVDVMSVGISSTGTLTGPAALATGVNNVGSNPSIAVNTTTGAYCSTYTDGNKLKIQPVSAAVVGSASEIAETGKNIGIIYIAKETSYIAAWLDDGNIKYKILRDCADDPDISISTLASSVQTGVLVQSAIGFGLFVVDTSGTSDRFLAFDSVGDSSEQSIFGGAWDSAGFWPAAGANTATGLFAAVASPDRKTVKFAAQLGTLSPGSSNGGPAAKPTVLPVPSKGLPTDLGQLINALYNWALAIIGLVIFVRFVWAGVKWFTAAGRSGPIGEAKTIMKNAAYGAAVLFSAYLILNTINPDFVGGNFNIPGLPATKPAADTTANATSCLTAGGSSYSNAVQNMAVQVLDDQPSLNASSSSSSQAAFIQALILELKNNGYTAGLVLACDGKGTIPLSIMVGYQASEKTGEVCSIFDSESDVSDSASDIKSTYNVSCKQQADWKQLQP